MRFGYENDGNGLGLIRMGNTLVTPCSLCCKPLRHLYKDVSKLHYDSRCHAFIEENEKYARKIFR